MGKMGIWYLCFYLPGMEICSSWHSIVVIVAAILDEDGSQSSTMIVLIATTSVWMELL